jgi:hypothetical protein
MNIRRRKAFRAIAAFLVLATAQLYVQISFAEPFSSETTVVPQQIIVARLVTGNNQAITVNNASAVTGATILTGATITTPPAVGATINLGALGTVDLAPDTTIRLDFDENGNLKVTLIKGCAVVKSNKNTQGEIVTETGDTVTKSNKDAGGVLDVCIPPGGGAPVAGQGAAAAAGAGASGGAGGAAAGGATAGTGGGIGTAAKVAIVAGIAGVAIGVPLAFSGGNPSPSQ